MGRDDDTLFEEAMRNLELPAGLSGDGDPGLGESAILARHGTQSLRTESLGAVSHDPMASDDDLFLEAMQAVSPEPEFVGPERSSVRQARPSRARRIRRGEMEADVTLDLHGFTREAALEALETCIARAQERKERVLLVICGRGLHSRGEAVLQQALQGWLNGPLRDDVVEHAPAAPKQGGRGAWWLFLRAKT